MSWQADEDEISDAVALVVLLVLLGIASIGIGAYFLRRWALLWGM